MLQETEWSGNIGKRRGSIYYSRDRRVYVAGDGRVQVKGKTRGSS
jgi:hypothetical protein